MRIILVAIIMALVSPAFAQGTTVVNMGSNGIAPQPPVLLRTNLPAGKDIRDSKGRVIHNQGTNGSVRLGYHGRITWDGNGNGTCNGEITEIDNTSSQGSNGPIDVNTNGEPTKIDLNQNGGMSITVIGGNATVNANANGNTVNAGGMGNTVNVGGNNNSINGLGNTSGGTVYLGRGTTGNAVNSGGGGWITVQR